MEYGRDCKNLGVPANKVLTADHITCSLKMTLKGCTEVCKSYRTCHLSKSVMIYQMSGRLNLEFWIGVARFKRNLVKNGQVGPIT